MKRNTRDNIEPGAAVSLFELLFSFTGRIPRRSWWTGFGVGCLATVAGSLALDPGVWTADPPRAPAPGLALWDLAWVIPMTAISVKRFNDRDRPQWVGYLVGAVGIALVIGEQMGFMVEPDIASAADVALLWLLVAIMLAAFIDNAVLKGTSGPNRYGPDPFNAPPSRGIAAQPVPD